MWRMAGEVGERELWTDAPAMPWAPQAFDDVADLAAKK